MAAASKIKTIYMQNSLTKKAFKKWVSYSQSFEQN